MSAPPDKAPPGSQPLQADAVAIDTRPSTYPEPFRARMAGRAKRRLGDHFGLKNFGVNLTTLASGAVSSLQHSHTTQDEFIYVLSGRITLLLGEKEFALEPGMVAGFPAKGPAHCLRNDGHGEARYLEIGDRLPGDAADYPREDLAVRRIDGKWVYFHKDGRPY